MAKLFPAAYVLVCFLFALLTMFYFQLSRPAEQEQYFVLHPNGQVDCLAGKEYSLHRNSRIGWLGCWLILIPLNKSSTKKTDKKNIRYFIFNDSISHQDYSRLTRYVIRAKTSNIS